MSLQAELEARTKALKGILDDSNDAITDKGGDAVKTLSDIPDAIRDLAGGELVDAYVVPTGQEFTEYPDGGGFGSVTVAGDYNLVPQNIAAGVTIYGVEGTLMPGATGSIPEEYQPYIDHALLLYTGEYENMAILEWNEYLAIVFMMSDFTLTEYNETTTEFKAQGWVSCSFNKLNDNWNFTDWRSTPSLGGNYVMNIRYSSVYWEYGGQVIWPFGMSGGGGGGGGAGLNIAYGDTAPDDATKLWVKAAEPNVVGVTTGRSFAAGTLSAFGDLEANITGFAAARVGENIYIFGGYSNAKEIAEIRKFNTITREVVLLNTTLSEAADGISTAVIGTKIYLFGGSRGYSRLYRIQVFDTESDTIAALSTSLKEPISRVNTAVVGKKVYLFGGFSTYGAVDSIYVFDTESETVSAIGQRLATARQLMATAVVGTSIYLLGGVDADGDLKDVYEFNTETELLAKKNYELPIAIRFMGHAQFGTKVYLIGGYAAGAALNSVIEVDVKTGVTSTMGVSLPEGQTGIAAVADGATIYAVLPGGAIYRLTVAAPLAPGTMILQYNPGGELFPIVNSDVLTFEISPATVHIGDASGIAQPAEAFIYKDGAWTAI